MSGGTPTAGGLMRQRHSQGYASSGDDLEDDACSRIRPQSPKFPATRTWIEVLENVLWIASAIFIIYLGDWHFNLIYILVHDGRIRSICRIISANTEFEVTGEPVEHTIPLLIARIERQDREIEMQERGLVRVRDQMESDGRGQRTVRQRVRALEEGQIGSDGAHIELFSYISSHQEMIDMLMTRVTTAEHQVLLFQQQTTELAQQLQDTAAVAAFLMFLLAAATQTGMFPRVM